MRLTILDGFRGYFLFFMAVVHINGIVHVTLGEINHHSLGWVEDAQGFVFISGFVVGLVYGGIYVRKSYEAMRRGILDRMRTIYTYHAGLVLLICAAALLLGLVGVESNIVHPYQAEPVLFTLLSLAILSASAFMGILPMYLWFMAVTPWALRAFRNDRTLAVLVLSVGLWLFAQTRLMDYLILQLGGVLDAWGHPMDLGLGFNILAWQVIFFSGLWLGLRQAEGRLDLSFLKTPQMQGAFVMAMALVGGLAVFDWIVQFQLVSPDYSGLAWSHVDRNTLSAIYFVAFFLDLFVISWLLVAGPTSTVRWAPAAARVIEAVFTWRPLVFLGQHSLQVFAWHVATAYLIDFVVNGRDLGEFYGTLVLVAGTASIFIPAWLHARSVAARKALRAAPGRAAA
ncbi:OpgC domain-containing protein [Rubellimicrobium arenae]|uniref:OpgC domain-containing protein n=1 Tax=Rubellimicrobium arenae TaxID=2817372 RepID=UPI001B3053F9|nr:OpgC domain-containing protein [Rubellimicrobium arenae]